MYQRRFIILGLCNTLLTAGATLARDEPKVSNQTTVAFRIVYRKDHKEKEWTAGTERFRTAQAAETAAQRLMEARVVVAAKAEAFDPATGKTVTSPRPQESQRGSAKAGTPSTSVDRGRNRSYPPGERPVPTDDGNSSPSSRSSRDSRPFINLGGMSVTNDFMARRRPPRQKGWLAAQGESKDKGSSDISRGKGDLGRRSYGTFQLISAPGKDGAESNVEAFVNRYYPKDFEGKEVNKLPFMETWLRLSLEDPESFRKNEDEFILKTDLNPMLSQLEKRLSLNMKDRSDTLREVLWAVAVQHGPGRGAQVVERAMKGKDVADLNDRDVIAAIYKERLRKDEDGKLAYFDSDETSDKVRAGVELRFAQEQNEALAALAGEPTTRQELQRRARKAQADFKKDVQSDIKKRAADEAKNRAEDAPSDVPKKP